MNLVSAFPSLVKSICLLMSRFLTRRNTGERARLELSWQIPLVVTMWNGGPLVCTVWTRIGEARACSRCLLGKQKALRTVCVGRRGGKPSVLKPRRLLLTLGLLVSLQLSCVKTEATCLSACAIGRRPFGLVRCFGTAMLTCLVVRCVLSCVLLRVLWWVRTSLRRWLCVMPTLVFCVPCLLGGSPLSRPSRLASRLSPLKSEMCSVLRVLGLAVVVTCGVHLLTSAPTGTLK